MYIVMKVNYITSSQIQFIFTGIVDILVCLFLKAVLIKVTTERSWFDIKYTNLSKESKLENVELDKKTFENKCPRSSI